MVFDSHPLMVITVLLEVWYQIFQYVASRDTKPKELLHYWSEKEEVKKKVAGPAAQNPNAEVPIFIFEGDQYEYECGSEDGDHDRDEDEDIGVEGDGEELNEHSGEAQGQDAEMDKAHSTAGFIFPAAAVPINTQGPARLTSTSSQKTLMSIN